MPMPPAPPRLQHRNPLFRSTTYGCSFSDVDYISRRLNTPLEEITGQSTQVTKASRKIRGKLRCVFNQPTADRLPLREAFPR
jgi:hypothetical protein